MKKAAGLYQPWFERLAYRVNIEAGENGTPVTEATVRIKVGGTGRAHRERGRRPGERARRGACGRRCCRFYPRLAEMQLVDYKVRVVNAASRHGGAGARRDRVARRRRTSGAPSASARTSSRRVAGAGRMRSSTSCSRTRKQELTTEDTETAEKTIREHCLSASLCTLR